MKPLARSGPAARGPAQSVPRGDGDRTGFDQLRSILVLFTPDFEILPGTAPKQASKPPKPFEIPSDLIDVD